MCEVHWMVGCVTDVFGLSFCRIRLAGPVAFLSRVVVSQSRAPTRVTTLVATGVLTKASTWRCRVSVPAVASRWLPVGDCAHTTHHGPLLLGRPARLTRHSEESASSLFGWFCCADCGPILSVLSLSLCRSTSVVVDVNDSHPHKDRGMLLNCIRLDQGGFL